jgi:V8-like Glu-specific endopeptidase
MDISSVIKQSTARAGSGYTRKRGTPEFKRSLRDWRRTERPERILNRMTGLGLAREAVDLAAAAIAGETTGGFNPLERIIEQSQLISSTFLALGAERMRAVGRIINQNGRGFGTGFLISPRLLLTNNHVIDNAGLAARCRIQFDFVRAVDGSIGTTEAFRFLPEVFFITAIPVNGLNLDYTIVAVEEANGDGRQLSRRGCVPLIETSGKLVTGDLANIIQHPGGEAQQVAIRDSEVVTPLELEHFIRYEADTQPGSSGSPVFNDLWQVGALHHSGVADEVRPGVYRLIDGGEWDTRQPLSHEDQLRMAARVKWVANEGVRISSIVRDVQGRLHDDVVKLAMFQQAITEQPALAALARVDRPTEAAPIVDGGSRTATWTLPIRVTIQLGPDAQLVMAGADAHMSPRVELPVPSVPSFSTTPEPPTRRSSGVDAAVVRASLMLSGVREVLDVRAGFVWKDGEMTDTEAIVVALDPNAALPAGDAFASLRIPKDVDGIPVDLTVGGATAVFRAAAMVPGVAAEALSIEDLLQEKVPTIGYEPPAGVALKEVTESMEVICHASPDDGWPVLEEFLDRTSKVITLGMFDLTAPHVVKKLKELGARRDFKLNLAIQKGMAGGLNGSKKNDIPEHEFIDEMQDLMGERFRQAFVDVSGSDRTFASSYHIKVAVRDHQEFWLSSGNMQTSNQPDISPAADGDTTFGPLRSFNREWHVVVKNPKLAMMFEKFLLHDLETAEANPAEDPVPRNEALLPIEPMDSLLLEARREATYFARDDGSARRDRITVQPLLTPDNYLDHVVPLVKSARETLFIQNQSLSILQPLEKNEDAFLELFAAIRDRQKAGVDVRLIFRVMPVDEDGARASKDALVKFGLRKNSIFVQENCHNKGVVVDSKVVLIGSHNWTNQGAVANRDASLIIRDSRIAKYFEEIFLFDWDNLTREPKPPRPGRRGPADEALGIAAGQVRVSLDEVVLGDGPSVAAVTR